MKSIFPKILPDDEDDIREIDKETMQPTGREPGITSEDSGEIVSPEAQAGVQRMEATTTVWTRNHLIAAYVLYVKPSDLSLLYSIRQYRDLTRGLCLLEFGPSLSSILCNRACRLPCSRLSRVVFNSTP